MQAFELCDTGRFLRAKAVKQANEKKQTSKTQALKMTLNGKIKPDKAALAMVVKSNKAFPDPRYSSTVF